MRDKTIKTEPKATNWHARSSQNVLKLLNSSEAGLTNSEAKNRQKIYGHNKVSRKHYFEGLKIFSRQFLDPLIILLIISVAISLYLKDSQTALVIAVLIVVNVLIGFFQEHKADRIMKSLSQLVSPDAKVLREGALTVVASNDLFPETLLN